MPKLFLSLSLLPFLLASCMPKQTTLSPEDALKKTAQTWIEQNAETYKYDGEDLKFQKMAFDEKDKTWGQLIFTFTSRHGGYGYRQGMILTQSLTPHTIVVEVQGVQGQIKSVITDEKFDEINQKMLEPGQPIYEVR